MVKVDGLGRPCTDTHAGGTNRALAENQRVFRVLRAIVRCVSRVVGPNNHLQDPYPRDGSEGSFTLEGQSQIHSHNHRMLSPKSLRHGV